MPETNILISKNIGTLRRAANLTQDEFAIKCGLRSASLGSWEEFRANPKIDDLLKITRFFKVSVEDFCTKDFSKIQKI